jgi:hypothetical protein
VLNNIQHTEAITNPTRAMEPHFDRYCSCDRPESGDAVPFRRRSGYGKDLSTYALDDYSCVRHVMVKL